MKKFATPIQLLDVENENSIGSVSDDSILMYAIDGDIYEKRPDNTTFKILTTEDIMYKTISVSGNVTQLDFVPANYKIASIVAEGDSTHSVQEFQILNSVTDDYVVLGVDIDSLVDIPIGKSLFSLGNATTLYISGSQWVNSIKFHFKLERVFI